ncbi:MAG: alpha/beta hydrolase [Chloroflexi bacterium 13_1_40CM_68_21]|nr:MAG: alpha/beta hydrolase [Chloroflexi bacterium 13_1_40CM_68_21]
MDQQKPDTILFIHGLYLTPRSWDPWMKRFQARGYRVVAPAWPGLEVEVEALRRDPSPIARQSVPEILAHYEKIIRGLARPPILIGHSFGGAFTQVLLGRGLGAAGVVLESGTVRGIPDLPFSTLKSSFPLLRNPLSRRKAIALTPEQFNYGFTNTFPKPEARRAYEQYAIPGSRNVLLTGAFANINPNSPLRVDFRNDKRAPLLFIAGGADHVIPASVVRHMAQKYARSTAITALREYPGRSHFTMIQAGWEELADYALSWAVELASVPATTPVPDAIEEKVPEVSPL